MLENMEGVFVILMMDIKLYGVVRGRGGMVIQEVGSCLHFEQDGDKFLRYGHESSSCNLHGKLSKY